MSKPTHGKGYTPVMITLGEIRDTLGRLESRNTKPKPMCDTIKRPPKRRKDDQPSDKLRHAGTRWIEKNLYRDVGRACEAFLEKRGLSEKSWYDKEPESDVMDSPAPPTPTPLPGV